MKYRVGTANMCMWVYVYVGIAHVLNWNGMDAIYTFMQFQNCNAQIRNCKLISKQEFDSEVE